MRARRTIPTVVLAVALGAHAHASTVCDAYQDLRKFGLIGRTLFKSTLSKYWEPGYCGYGMQYALPMCMTRGKLNGPWIYQEFQSGGDPILPHLVATQSSGTALTFKTKTVGGYECWPGSLAGDVITGGGAVATVGSAPDFYGAVDTTGTHPLVSSCSGAMVDMDTISAAIAAAPAVQTIDTLTVPRGETTVLDVTGGGIVRIRRLLIQGVRSRVQSGYNWECLYTPGYSEAAWLEIVAGPNDDVVLDVQEELKIGDCSYTYLPSENFLINVSGTGKKVYVGVDSRGDYALNILAPQRTVKVAGERSGELGTYLGFIWADKLLMKGYTYPEQPACTD